MDTKKATAKDKAFAYAALTLFGFIFALFVRAIRQENPRPGVTATLVAIGCSVIIFTFHQLHKSNELTLILLQCFAAAGLPMIWGDLDKMGFS